MDLTFLFENLDPIMMSLNGYMLVSDVKIIISEFLGVPVDKIQLKLSEQGILLDSKTLYQSNAKDGEIIHCSIANVM